VGGGEREWEWEEGAGGRRRRRRRRRGSESADGRFCGDSCHTQQPTL
jgi:hypothetical protein